MKIDNEINVRIVKAIIEHMKRSGYNEEQILDELKEKNYQIETILKAEKLMDAEKNTCSFCRAVDEVSRIYLHAKNKPMVGDGFDFIYYCNKCGLSEYILPEETIEVIKQLKPIQQDINNHQSYNDGKRDAIEEIIKIITKQKYV